MAKVRITKTITKTVEVEVEFPLYRRHDLHPDDDGNGVPESVVYTQVTPLPDGGFLVVDIHLSILTAYTGELKHFRFELEMEHESKLGGDDYALGTGSYACTPTQFHDARRVAMRAYAMMADPDFKMEHLGEVELP